MELIELRGQPRDMGKAFGEACRSAIRELYAFRLANAIEQAHTYGGRRVGEGDLLHLAEQCLTPVRAYAPEGLEELDGVAVGSGLSLAQIWVMNALTDLRDVAAYGEELGHLSAHAADSEGCSSIVVPPARSVYGEALTAQTWDLSSNNMPYVRMVRRYPSSGPATLSMTTVGCLSLVGLNEWGIAVGTTNLRTLNARVGAGYLDIIHRALYASTFSEARDAIVDAPRAGAHYYYLVAGATSALGLECSADKAETVSVTQDTYIHCNHCLCTSIISQEAQDTPSASSHHRQQRLTALAADTSQIGPEDLKRFCADTHGGDLAISRKDVGGISTNACVVMYPAQKRLWFVHGPADLGSWVEYRLSVDSGD